MSQVFAHGQLRLYLLSLLSTGPKHGYELITALSDRFGGTYRPSAGTVYPRLARLEDEGLVRRSDDGRKSTYALTEAGSRELAARSGDLAALEEDLAESVRALAAGVREDVRGAMASLRADLAAAAQQARASAVPDHRDTGEHRSRSRARRAEAEALVSRFRDEIRADLRLADTRGEIDQLTVDTLRTVLETARTAVRSTLPDR